MWPLTSCGRWIPAALLALLSNSPVAAFAQDSRLLHVQVRDARSHRALPGAVIRMDGTTLAGVTNQIGVLRVQGLTPGSHVLEVRFLGFAPAREIVVLPLSGTSRRTVDLAPQPIQLAAVEVKAAERRDFFLERNGFYERIESGWGRFITQDQIESAKPAMLSDMLRRVPGLRLSRTFAGLSPQTATSVRSTSWTSCPIQYFLDGNLIPNFHPDEVSPQAVSAIEVYLGSNVPAIFNKGNTMCGVIAIWSRVDYRM